MENCEVMTSSTHSFAYSYRLVKKCFVKICETSKCHNFLIFQPIFIRFSLLCLKIFTLSSEIKLNMLWSSSLLQCGHRRMGPVHVEGHTHFCPFCPNHESMPELVHFCLSRAPEIVSLPDFYPKFTRILLEFLHWQNGGGGGEPVPPPRSRLMRL